MGKTIVAQIAELECMPVKELRTKWEALFDASPPASSNRKQMVARLSYRIQELALGGLSREARERLETIAGTEMPDGNGKPMRHDSGLPVPGTKLVREWQGQRIEVTVLEKGFECGGKRYRSLSAIASAITGTKWNGWEFFGLRSKGANGKPAGDPPSTAEE
jgi:hypothetical protein